MTQPGKTIPPTLDDPNYKDNVVRWLENNGHEVTLENWLDMMYGDDPPDDFEWPKELQDEPSTPG